MNEVELLYNPYKNKSRITINGQAISLYSTLANFINEPFHKWCHLFIPQLENELNGKFNLIFVSRKTETEIMHRFASQSQLCEKFSGRDLILNTPLAKRMSNLNKLIVSSKTMEYQQKIIPAWFYVSEEFSDFREALSSLEIRNAYCKVEVKTALLSKLCEPKDGEVVFCVVDTTDRAKELSQRFQNSNSFPFILIVNSTHQFVGKVNNCFIYETRDELLEECIFECFLFITLLEAFIKVKKDISNEKLQQLQEYKMLDEVDAVVVVKAQSRVEVGQGILLDKQVYPDNLQDVPLEFQYDKENIAICDGRIIKGLSEGDVKITVFRKGDLIPLTVLPIDVYQTNRITEIFIDENSIDLPVGGSRILRSSYLPEDADNAGSLKWLSTNEAVATIDSRGCVRGLKTGRTTIIRNVNRVEAKCEVYVKDILEDLELSTQKIEIFRGESGPLAYRCLPEGCFKEDVYVYVEQRDLISYDKGIVYGENPGQTFITFYTKNKKIAKTCEVRVLDHNKDPKAKPKKKGLLSSLFGR